MADSPQETSTNNKPSAPLKGKLIMAGNSIGMPIDIPPRSLEALRSSNMLIFEEDRPARAALKAAGIHRTYYKFNEHGQDDTLDAMRDALKQKETVCYMSDQGMPTLADPGRALMEIAYELGVSIQVIPGPSSITAALAACPFLEDSFHYEGFLSRDADKRQREFRNIAKKQEPVVLLEAPYRRDKFIEQCEQHLGGNRKALLALDISGPEENYLYGSLGKLKKTSRSIPGKLNFVLIVDRA
jgi:16S rRNA (cytidine1402-2'-O)-methyltransferase